MLSTPPIAPPSPFSHLSSSHPLFPPSSSSSPSSSGSVSVSVNVNKGAGISSLPPRRLFASPQLPDPSLTFQFLSNPNHSLRHHHQSYQSYHPILDPPPLPSPLPLPLANSPPISVSVSVPNSTSAIPTPTPTPTLTPAAPSSSSVQKLGEGPSAEGPPELQFYVHPEGLSIRAAEQARDTRGTERMVHVRFKRELLLVPGCENLGKLKQKQTQAQTISRGLKLKLDTYSPLRQLFVSLCSPTLPVRSDRLFTAIWHSPVHPFNTFFDVKRPPFTLVSKASLKEDTSPMELLE